MSEKEAIDRVKTLPATIESMVRDLTELGVNAGALLLVHSSLSSLGWVNGGPVAVVEALKCAVGDSGTIVMPTHTSGLSDPANWENPPVPRSWWPLMRETMPAFDSRMTPTRGMGAIVEVFRTCPGAMRSEHPQLSFAALGPRAEEIVRDHHLADGLGEDSPLGRLYDLGGMVLLLGVDHDRNTSLHLGERRAIGDRCTMQAGGAPLRVEGKRVWVEFQAAELDEGDFCEIGKAFAEATSLVKCGALGAGKAMLMPQRELVDFGEQWIREHRRAGSMGQAARVDSSSPSPQLELPLSDDHETFSEWAQKIADLLGGSWERKVEGLDQAYWNLSVDDVTLTIHREHYLGVVVICPDTAEGEALIERIKSCLMEQS